MIAIDVRVDAKRITQALDKLSKVQVQTATVRALNKAAGNVQTEAIREVRKSRALLAKSVRQAFKIRKANKGNLVASVIATGRPIPLRDYRANQTKAGVTAMIKPGKRTLWGVPGRRAFKVAKIGNHVFQRQDLYRDTKRGRLEQPIKKQYGPNIPSALTKASVSRVMGRIAVAAFQKRFTEEMRFELRKAGLARK
jgi:hypothetical protein